MALTDTVGPPEMPKPGDIDDAVLKAFDELDAPEQTSDGGWRIHDAGGADWALRKLAIVEAKRDEVNALAARQIESVNALIEPYLTPIMEWQAAQMDKIHADAERWEALLIAYHREVLAENDREKTIKLPHGTLSARKAPDKWEFDDEVFIAWVKTNGFPDMVRTKEEVSKTAVKNALKDNVEGDVVAVRGEIVPGLTVTVGEPSFTVTTEDVAR